jgi:hypothetical protein
MTPSADSGIVGPCGRVFVDQAARETLSATLTPAAQGAAPRADGARAGRPRLRRRPALFRNVRPDAHQPTNAAQMTSFFREGGSALDPSGHPQCRRRGISLSNSGPSFNQIRPCMDLEHAKTRCCTVLTAVWPDKSAPIHSLFSLQRGPSRLRACTEQRSAYAAGADARKRCRSLPVRRRRCRWSQSWR